MTVPVSVKAALASCRWMERSCHSDDPAHHAFLETIDETFDVGVDTRTGVDDEDYQPPFRFTGKVDKLTVKLVPLKAAEEKLLEEKAQEKRETTHSKSHPHLATRQ